MTRCVVGCSSIARGIEKKTNVHLRLNLAAFSPALGPHNIFFSRCTLFWGDALFKHTQGNYNMFVTVVKAAEHKVSLDPKAKGPKSKLFFSAQ